ncbi:MAG TPA: outer membrane lipoprotein-sorting protein [Bacteroidales bacterium]|nr:outer membrane lipoprotein-sorting protein [Bacteroidales bacterium]HRZ48141.1 outer membrane lipoprotein-sorting protein [Bacteroidales bacterium]
MKLIALLSVLLLMAADPLTPRQISDKASEAIRFDAMEMTSTLTITDKNGNSRTRQVTNTTKKFKETTKTRMRFLSPAEVAGTTILIHDHDKKEDDMWIYMPSLKNSRRIVSSEKGKSFMGSEFTNADMTRPNSDEYTFSQKGTTTIGGKKCWIIETVFANKKLEKDYGFQKKLMYIDQASYLSYRIEYYGTDGKLMRTVTYSDYRKQPDGKFFSFSMKAENHKTGRKSTITVDKFKSGTDQKESYFDPGRISE